MSFTYNGKSIEKVNYNNNKINIVQFNDNVVLEYDIIYNITYTASAQMTATSDEKAFNLNFTSNNKEYKGIKVAPTYIHYISNDNTETNVYAFDTESWAELYKSIIVKEITYVDSDFYDWFKVNYIKG